jgi:hypothetical protein
MEMERMFEMYNLSPERRKAYIEIIKQKRNAEKIQWKKRGQKKKGKAGDQDSLLLDYGS